jgi:uncharacterized membrane protein YfcA
MVDSRHFLFSFLDVITHYIAFFVGLLLLLFLAMYFGWPEQLELWTPPKGLEHKFTDVWENEPHRLFPAGLNATLVAGGLILAGVLGYSVARFAPFAPGGHGTLLAVLCALTLLQIAFAQPQLPKALSVPLMIASVAGIVAGSRLADRLMADRRSVSGLDETPDPGDDEVPE